MKKQIVTSKKGIIMGLLLAVGWCFLILKIFGATPILGMLITLGISYVVFEKIVAKRSDHKERYKGLKVLFVGNIVACTIFAFADEPTFFIWFVVAVVVILGFLFFRGPKSTESSQ